MTLVPMQNIGMDPLPPRDHLLRRTPASDAASPDDYSTLQKEKKAKKDKERKKKQKASPPLHNSRLFLSCRPPQSSIWRQGWMSG